MSDHVYGSRIATFVLAFVMCAEAARAGIEPVSQAGAITLNGVLSNVVNPGNPMTNLIVFQDATGKWAMGGIVDGLPVDPVPIYVGDDEWLENSGSDGASTTHDGLGHVKRITIHLKDEFNGELAVHLVHEAVHAYLALSTLPSPRAKNATTASISSCTPSARRTSARRLRTAT